MPNPSSIIPICQNIAQVAFKILNNNHYVLLLHSECLFHKMSHNSRKTEDGLHELSEFELAEFKQAFREFDKDPIFGSID